MTLVPSPPLPMALVISDEVYNIWVDAQPDESETTEAPAKRKPGRPRKSQES